MDLINPSLHSMCAHAWQLYDICSGPIAISLLISLRVDVEHRPGSTEFL